MPERWTISTMAVEYGVTLRTLRHYEELGLLSPERVGSARVYHQRDRIRLELILRGKRLGFSLGEIAVIVNMYDQPPGEAGQLEYLLDQCAVRREELEQRRRDIDDTLRELDEVEQRCRHDLVALRTAT
ncbi:MAG TPA: MerR family DNA-binding transcriptional regulator [Marmoricola sp.]|nr:MerR family DNA-binding transcriptional regulator [Marmoricola sp.]